MDNHSVCRAVLFRLYMSNISGFGPGISHVPGTVQYYCIWVCHWQIWGTLSHGYSPTMQNKNNATSWCVRICACYKYLVFYFKYKIMPLHDVTGLFGVCREPSSHPLGASVVLTTWVCILVVWHMPCPSGGLVALHGTLIPNINIVFDWCIYTDQ